MNARSLSSRTEISHTGLPPTIHPHTRFLQNLRPLRSQQKTGLIRERDGRLACLSVHSLDPPALSQHRPALRCGASLLPYASPGETASASAPAPQGPSAPAIHLGFAGSFHSRAKEPFSNARRRARRPTLGRLRSILTLPSLPERSLLAPRCELRSQLPSRLELRSLRTQVEPHTPSFRQVPPSSTRVSNGVNPII